MNLNVTIFAIILCLLVGCNPAHPRNEPEFTPIKNGFGFAQHSKESSLMHQSVWADFQYQDTNGVSALVWPFINQIDSIQISNNTAVLLGDKARLYGDGKERLTTRLIAFEAPTGPAMDITDQVVKKWCSEKRIDFTNVMQDSFIELKETSGALQLGFGVIKRDLRGPGTVDTTDGIAVVSWNEVKVIMQDIKETGKLKKEKWSGVEYLQKD